jgi:hypothetical protein
MLLALAIGVQEKAIAMAAIGTFQREISCFGYWLDPKDNRPHFHPFATRIATEEVVPIYSRNDLCRPPIAPEALTTDKIAVRL